MQGILSNLVRQGSLPLRTRIQALLEIYLLRKAGVVTVESEWGRQMIQRIRGPKPIHVIEYGVQKVFYQAVWRPLPECPYCLFVGTLNRQKGIQDLVEAFRDPRLRKYELRVIGEGDPNWVRPLQANAPPNVKWLGRRSPQEVAAEMEKSWCLALPTRADTSPNVVKEARVVGLPVVTTSAGGQAQYVADGEDGFLCDPGQISLWVTQMQTLLADLETTKRVGLLGTYRYREVFRPEQTAAKFYDLYKKILSTREENRAII
jgi:glycosyltransferase involved in cell wall biosynthesis